MSNNGDTYIAGQKTVADWLAFRKRLTSSYDAELWNCAFQEYFLQRLEQRYLHPIKVLQKYGTWKGEGFSILALQCTLVEFLESTFQGMNYRFVSRRSPDSHEYSQSSDIFVSFLCNRSPFTQEFNEKLAREFYRSVRCGLLHEARTKDGWKVQAKSTDRKIVNGEKRIIYRNNFQKGLDEVIGWYGKTLPKDAKLQEGFIRKFDNLCS